MHRLDNACGNHSGKMSIMWIVGCAWKTSSGRSPGGLPATSPGSSQGGGAALLLPSQELVSVNSIIDGGECSHLHQIQK